MDARIGGCVIDVDTAIRSRDRSIAEDDIGDIPDAFIAVGCDEIAGRAMV